jgi:hypothetical protein
MGFDDMRDRRIKNRKIGVAGKKEVFRGTGGSAAPCNSRTTLNVQVDALP